MLDDTQALGILGCYPRPDAPYGEGGGGSLRHFGIQSPEILSGNSLVKGFGVPVAVLAGTASQPTSLTWLTMITAGLVIPVLIVAMQVRKPEIIVILT